MDSQLKSGRERRLKPGEWSGAKKQKITQEESSVRITCRRQMFLHALPFTIQYESAA